MNTAWTMRAWLLTLVFAQGLCRADTLVDTDFSKGDFQKLGWKADGAWDIFTYPADKNNPGPVARFAANKPDGTLTKTFDEIKNPRNLAMSLDVGWGWGAADHSQGIGFMLLDDNGNGYLFQTARAKANWGAQWARVTGNKVPENKNWAPEAIDTTQAAIRDGGGVQSLTVTRDIDGNWTFASKSWNKGAGGAFKFTDTTTTHFAKLVLVGTRNLDELAFNKIVLDATQGSDYPQNRISVTTPAYGADVKGDTQVALVAPGFTKTTVKCWKQGTDFGSDSTIGEVTLDDRGRGSIVFPADQYPHGPVTVRIADENGKVKDNCYLQLYNKGGVSWNEGMPKEPPPAAAGMKLVFADDFDKPLSIGDDPKAAYYDHKPPNGSQDFSTVPFTSFNKPNNPFSQMDTYLRIRASEKAHSAGLISSLKNDGSGVTASAPCYFECRFLAPNAIGTWPAFWLLTVPTPHAKGVDELDIIEGYGGEGAHEPNAGDGYMITPHAWDQGNAGKTLESAAFKAMKNPCHVRKFGIPSTWFETFHTYGCKITGTDTVYYCDNVEVGRHETLPLSKKTPFFFLINLATGGGWPVDLSRYDGHVDMYVDYVRVYGGADAKP
jgi:hypothetical protein